MTSPLYQKFADKFGTDQADAVMRAANQHDNDVHGNRGSDPFRWAISIALGYECIGRFAADHGITADLDDVRAWIKAEADLGSHDGDVDFLAALCGVYDEFIGDQA